MGAKNELEIDNFPVRPACQMIDARIRDLLETNEGTIIAIDGEPGAGKTSVGLEIAREADTRCIHVDDFLAPGQDAYVDALDIGKLQVAVVNSGRPLIVEGICLRYVLERIGIEADFHVFVHRDRGLAPYKRHSSIVAEVDAYIAGTNADQRSDLRITMADSRTNQLDVDIAYLKAKTIVSVVLALGGIAAIIVGVIVLNAGIQAENSTVIRILGAEVTAKGLGGVILSSSVLWAYFSYLSRPKYSRRKESRRNVAADGSEEAYEFESSTMVSAESDPPESVDR